MKKTKKILILLLLLLISILYNIKDTNNNIKDDYYENINEKILKENTIEENEVGWSMFSKSQKNVDEKVSSIIENIVKYPATTREEKISNFYNLITNKEKRNQDGLSVLTKYIDMINSSNNIKEFINNSIKIETELNIDIFTQATVSKDFKDNTKNIIYFYPINFDYGVNSDYYTESNYIYYHALLKQSNIRLLKQYGYTKEEARKSAKSIDEFYKNIANSSKTSKDLKDIESYYNIITKEELQNIYTNIDIEYYFQKLNISNIKTFSIVDIENYKALNSFLTNDNLYTLKEYVKLKILQNYCLYANHDYSNIIYELNTKLQGLEEDNTTEDEKAQDIVKNYFNYDIDEYYTNNYFTTEEENYIKEMITDILEYYKEQLNDNSWLSKETIKLAIEKLDNIEINIGMPENYTNYSDNYKIDNNISLIENIINIKKVLSEYTLSQLNENKSVLSLSQTTVNAYYNPQENSINFPAASSLVFDLNKTYYQNLGSIGMVIAHEITHAFDTNGAKFDKKGNLNNWWIEEDYNEFNKLKEKVIEYYNKYEVVDGLYLNGELTVDENIADLGALSCITSIAKNRYATKDEIKMMFESFANMWASEYTESYQKALLLQDNHSPNKYRVNATLSSNEEFYKVYNITLFNGMYINEKYRIKVW